jgi:hypothetical protein
MRPFGLQVTVPTKHGACLQLAGSPQTFHDAKTTWSYHDPTLTTSESSPQRALPRRIYPPACRARLKSSVRRSSLRTRLAVAATVYCLVNSRLLSRRRDSSTGWEELSENANDGSKFTAKTNPFFSGEARRRVEAPCGTALFDVFIHRPSPTATL